jgi:hexosaminidase
MSQLHWHITDAQSFPLVIPSHPEVSKAGAYSAEEVYSPADVADIVAYAAAVSCFSSGLFSHD